MTKYGSDLIVDAMLRYGIEYAALNPGSTFRGLHDSIVNYGGNRPEIIECPHEEIAVAIAHGYARATGRPMAAIVHDVVGLLHATMAVYYAYLDRAPVILMGATGPMEITRRRPHIDWIHTAVAQGGAVRDYTKWDYQPFGAEDVVESFARAYRVATTDPQGPVYLCYDAAFQEDALEAEPAIPAPESVLPTRLYPDPGALDTLAGWLLKAERPVLMAQLLGRRPENVALLVELAELLGATVVDTGERFNFPSTHPLNMTGADGVFEAADLVVAFEVRDLHGEIALVDRVNRTTVSRLSPGCRVAEIGYGDVGIRRRAQETATRHRLLREGWASAAAAVAGRSPIATAHLAQALWNEISQTDWVLTANTLRDWTRRLWNFDRPSRHPGGSLGTATQIGISLGVALAHRGSGRLVVDIQPDGDLLFDAGALWVASHHEIPMLVVMYNNRSYYNDWEHQVLIARQRGRDEEMAYVGMELDRPAPDFAMLARSFGWHAEGPIESPRDLGPALAAARRVVLEKGRPALVDVVTEAR